MKWSIISMIIILIITSTIVSADHRPNYSFDNSVFDDLPVFPEDFYEIKSLFETSKITAWKMGEEYLQPELIPRWNYWSKEIYADENYSHFGIYGLAFYPSWMHIYDVQAGDHFNLSVFAIADWGIKFYQGCRIAIPEIDGLDIELISPANQNLLLSPTYPFIEGWMQKVLVHIHVLKTGNYTIKITETKPQIYAHEYWSETLGDDYVALGGLTQSAWTIYLHQPPVEHVNAENKGLLTFMGFALTGIIAIAIIAYILRKLDGKRKEQNS